MSDKTDSIEELRKKIDSDRYTGIRNEWIVGILKQNDFLGHLCEDYEENTDNYTKCLEKQFDLLYCRFAEKYNLPKITCAVRYARDINCTCSIISNAEKKEVAIIFSEILLNFIYGILIDIYMLHMAMEAELPEPELHKFKKDIVSKLDQCTRERRSTKSDKEFFIKLQMLESGLAKASAIGLTIVNFIICHELAHIINKDHEKDSRELNLQHEIEADILASELYCYMIDNRKDFTFMPIEMLAVRGPLVFFELMDLVDFYHSVVIDNNPNILYSEYLKRKDHLIANCSFGYEETSTIHSTMISDIISEVKVHIQKHKEVIRKFINKS